jgi:protein SCO1
MNKPNRPARRAASTAAMLAAFVLASLLCPPARAVAQTAPPRPERNSLPPEAKGLSAPAIPDVEAFDQDGKPLRFYTDLIKGKTVMLNFVFTSCTYVCRMQGANFSRLQAALGRRLGADISLVSVSLDPQRDTPERLKSWGAKYGARPGWTMVTGAKPEMDRLLRALTGDASGVTEHSSVLFMGDYERGIWIRADSLDDPARLIQTLDAALAR